jgi:hypothetical protein
MLDGDWSSDVCSSDLTLSKCSFTTSGTEGMMIYQSASGDAADGDATTSKASMVITDSTIIATANKPMIYVTNTECVVKVTNSKLTHLASTPLLSLAADRWGNSGSNGGHAAVTLAKTSASGALTADSVSSATVELTKSSAVRGAASAGVTVTTDASSTWTS